VREPAVSVVIPAYNRERFIESAVRSVIHQTFTDWELIVVDDGSTDSTAPIVQSNADPRIRVVALRCNSGIAAARNLGLEEARGQFIAWLDSDDVAKPDRLARQVAYLRDHPDVALVGGCAHKIADDGRRLPGTRVPPFEHDDIRCRQLLTSAFQQSAIMGRANVLKNYRYDPSFEVCEDIDVCVRIAVDHRLANMPAVLVERRMHATQVSRRQKDKVLVAQARITMPQFDRMGFSAGNDELFQLTALARTPDFKPQEADLRWAESILADLLAANMASEWLPQRALRMFAGILMFDRYRRYSSGRAVSRLISSPFAGDLVQLRTARWLAGVVRATAFGSHARR